ncbi:MAG: hypothetical protein ACK4FA_02035 [Candidatus Paceibacteria bacterium]
MSDINPPEAVVVDQPVDQAEMEETTTQEKTSEKKEEHVPYYLREGWPGSQKIF